MTLWIGTPTELADFSVNFLVRPWVKTEDFGATRSDLLERIKVGFDERGFTIPCPVPDIVGTPQLIKQTSSTKCVSGTNFGGNARGMWVKNGCAGQFQVRYYD